MIDTKVLQFQQDIKAGMSIDDALCKHNLTLLEAWENIHGCPRGRPANPRPKPKHKSHTTGEKYISLNQNGYMLRKGKKYFGRYDTLADAVFVRDYLMEFGWTHRHMVTARNKL
jgi:hypothetical protein